MNRKQLRLLIYSLLLVIIFEGIIRKVMPGALSKMMIFAKDGVVLLIAFSTVSIPLKGTLKKIRSYLVAFAIALFPLIVYTATKDPILAVFGAKQYLLFPFLLFGFVLAFNDYGSRDFIKPLRLITLLLFPLTGLAIIQIFLPDNHWLNLSVSGESLSAFKAGGRLRVSSTFPFVAQFCYYLTVLLPVIWVTLTLKPKRPKKTLLDRIEALYLIIPFFIVANVVTGSRLAVVTNVMTIVFATGLLMSRGHTKNIGRLVGFILLIVVSVFVAKLIVPETFEAYQARAGDSAVVDKEELSQRAESALMSWWNVYKYKNPGILGYGIGSMSNGVQNFSSYAASVRSKAWGETDLGNTVLEGGLYLVIIFQAFRILVIFECFKVYRKIQSQKLAYMSSFVLGYIIFNGLTQTLGTQPPLAIWWWFSIGLLMHTQRFELYLIRQNKMKLKKVDPPSSIPPQPRHPKPPSPRRSNKVKPLPNLKPKLSS